MSKKVLLVLLALVVVLALPGCKSDDDDYGFAVYPEVTRSPEQLADYVYGLAVIGRAEAADLFTTALNELFKGSGTGVYGAAGVAIRDSYLDTYYGGLPGNTGKTYAADFKGTDALTMSNFQYTVPISGQSTIFNALLDTADMKALYDAADPAPSALFNAAKDGTYTNEKLYTVTGNLSGSFSIRSRRGGVITLGDWAGYMGKLGGGPVSNTVEIDDTAQSTVRGNLTFGIDRIAAVANTIPTTSAKIISNDGTNNYNIRGYVTLEYTSNSDLIVLSERDSMLNVNATSETVARVMLSIDSDDDATPPVPISGGKFLFSARKTTNTTGRNMADTEVTSYSNLMVYNNSGELVHEIPVSTWAPFGNATLDIIDVVDQMLSDAEEIFTDGGFLEFVF